MKQSSERDRSEIWRCSICGKEIDYTPPSDSTVTQINCVCGGQMFVVAARQQSERPIPRAFAVMLLKAVLVDAKTHILHKSTRKRERWDDSAIEWNRAEYLESPTAYIIDAVLGISPEEQAAKIFSHERLPKMKTSKGVTQSEIEVAVTK
jgi:DNA-directed RNA polymerase subunit RPC12/RpoP